MREAAVFWGLMRTLTEFQIEPNQIPWLSTHPDHGDRENRINARTAKALELRKLHGVRIVSYILDDKLLARE